MTTTRTSPPVPADAGWTLVVPVKALDRAKSRLARALDPALRRRLVLAMATDVLTACVATPGVARVRVVTSDPEVAGVVRRLGQEVVPEPEPAGDSDPLNAALAAGLVGVSGPIGVVTADLPELRPELLAGILTAAARYPHSVVPDHRGAGTTMAFWTGTGGQHRIPRFGTDSATRHLDEGGAVLLDEADPTGATGRDVDTPEDLLELAGRRVGAATAAALGALSGALPPHAGEVSATMVP